jgi:cephalosporin hydroxylase
MVNGQNIKNRMKVGDLLLKYETDKNKGKTLLKDGHYYGDSYDRIFEQFDKNSSLNILEVGVQKGGSLLAWKDFFQNSYVVGIDILDARLNEYIRNDVNFILSDSNDISLKENPLIKDKFFDIIIDDGSHHLPDVIFFMENYIGQLNLNGYFIVEDCQSPEYWLNTILQKLDDRYEISVNDMRTINNYYDDYLIIIKKIK